jgi:hypothetical protein
MIHSSAQNRCMRPIAFGDLILALDYNVLAPLNRGDLQYHDGPLPTGDDKAMHDHAFVLVLAEDFVEATANVPDTKPQRIMVQQLLAVLQTQPYDFKALIAIFAAAARATAMLPNGSDAHACIMRGLALLDGLMEHRAIALGMNVEPLPTR